MRAWVLLLLLAACGAQAADIWISTGFVSRHLTHSAQYAQDNEYRENNTGVGFEVGAVAFGNYMNSTNRPSTYALYRWQPLALGAVRIGLAAGIVDGYESVRGGDYFPVAMPVASIEGRRVGANLIVAPKFGSQSDAFVALQFKVRVDFF